MIINDIRGLNINDHSSIVTNSGDPEGIVTAPVGSLSLDYTNGTIYIKNTGVGNTGWELVASASGILNWVTATDYALNDTVFTEGRIYRANTAHTSGATFNGDRANWDVLVTIPTGTVFSGTTYYYAGDVVVETGALYRRITSGTSGATFDVTEQANWTALTASSETSWRLPVSLTGTETDAGTNIVGQLTYSLDGVALVDGDFILLQGETTAPATYFGRVFEVGGVGAAITLTLREDGQAGDGVPADGDYIHVTAGTDYADTLWHYDGSVWTIALGVPPYTTTFNATTDWGAASGGYYTITIPEATHGQGTATIDVSFFESSGGEWVSLMVDSYSINQTTGDVTFSVSELPDGRFAGRVTLDAGLGGIQIVTGGGGGTNIMDTDLTQTGVRAHDMDGFTQTFNNASGGWNYVAGTSEIRNNPATPSTEYDDGASINVVSAEGIQVTDATGTITANSGGYSVTNIGSGETATLLPTQVGSTDTTFQVLFGDESVDGTWRMIRVGANLEVQLRVAGVFVQKGVFTP